MKIIELKAGIEEQPGYRYKTTPWYTFIHKSILIMMALIIVDVRLFAINSEDCSITNTSYDEYGPFVEFLIPFYDDVDNDDYFNGSLYATVSGSEHTIATFFNKQQADDSWYWGNVTPGSGFVIRARSESSRTGWLFSNSTSSTLRIEDDCSKTARMYLRWYIPSAYIDKTITFRIYGDWAAGDVNGYNFGNTSKTISHPIPDISLTPAISATNGKMDVSYSYTSALHDRTTIAIDNGSYISASASGKLPVDKSNDVITHTVHSKYSPKSYIVYTRDKTVTVPAYHWPLNLSASYDISGKVTLTWDIGTYDSNCIKEDEFEIERSDQADFSQNIKTFDLVRFSTATNYSMEDDVRDENNNKILYYRIRRTASADTWRWNVAVPVNILVNSEHLTVAAAEAPELISDADGNKAIIRWSINDGVWSTGSRLIIKKLNKTTGISSEIAELEEADMRSCQYTDENIVLCEEYSYTLSVIPGISNYAKPDPVKAPGSVLASEIGSIYDLSVSKGYYPDRVSLQWKGTGPFDKFIIKRTIYGEAGDTIQIATVASSLGGDYYITDDTKGSPGVYYVYFVEGVVLCNKKELYSNCLSDIGFRSPTGNVYGRVTYSGGTAVPNVEIIVSSDDVSSQGKSFLFNGTDAFLSASDNKNSLSDTGFSVEAWISPVVAEMSNKTIFCKPGKYELGFDATGQLFFANGSDRVSFKYDGFADNLFTHISGVRSSDKILLYANDSLLAFVNVPIGPATANTDSILIGKNITGNYFNGYIDEVRLWNKALTKAEISRDYTRLLAGSETSLAAYWRFDEPIEDAFYDISFKGSTYNEHHGKAYNTVRSSTVVPTTEQLMLKGITDNQGNYLVSGISYLGDGTIYTFRPRFDIHSFDPVSVNRIISSSNSSYVLDFTDNSSFPLSIDIYYKNSTYPVKEVGFKIDGSTVVLNDGTQATTDDNGEVTLDVPIGQHTVQAFLSNHSFTGEGFITTPTGEDRNYQSAGTASLEDITKVRILGRVAGGVIQQEIPLGFSRSKNNLGDNAAVKIELAGIKYNITNAPGTEETITHYKPKTAGSDFVDKTTRVVYSDRYVTVYPDTETGEFVLDLIPISFNVTAATVKGYGSIISSNIPLDLSSVFSEQTSILETKDSVLNSNGVKVANTISDTLFYNAALNINHREKPSVTVRQLSRGGKYLDYFGNKQVISPTFSGINDTINVFDETTKAYLFDNRPVFIQGEKYNMKISVFELYKYNKSDDGIEDMVPSEDGTVEINNLMNVSGAVSSVEIDSLGTAGYSFIAADPNLSTGIKTIDISAKIDNGTYLWSTANPFIYNSLNPGAFLLGKKSTGTNFVTAGPDEVLMVIRDPHGSGSSAFVQQGSVITKSSTTTVSAEETGESEVTVSMGTKVVTWVGVGAGVINEAETTNDGSVSVSESYTGVYSGGSEETITMNTIFSTSDSPDYVGHDGDVFVGNSTNISYGLCDNVSFIKKKNVSSSDTKLWGYDTAGDNDYVLVSQKSIAGQKNFGTLFVYPLNYIENTLIPNLISLRNTILGAGNGLSASEAQIKANATGNQVYVSKLSNGQAGYGEANTSSYWGDQASDDYHYNDGLSYTIYFPAGCTTQTDTILSLNQSINGWKEELAGNEKAKIEAELFKNYSISSGSSFSLSKQTDNTESKTREYSVVIGGSVGWVLGGEVLGMGMKLDLKEEVSITTGGSSSISNTGSFTTGFTLADDSGYLSEDVCAAENGSYVFKLKGGATACPYEGAYSSSYYKAGTIIDQPSMQMQVPKISVKGSTTLTDIPANKKGTFQLQLNNESESGDDATFILKIDESSNPFGASFYLDGSPLGDGRTLLVRYGEALLKTLEVGKGANAMEFTNLRLILRSECQSEIADTVNLSVSFVPACTDLSLEFPLDNWVVNTNTGETEETQILPFSVTDYDINQSSLYSIVLECKPSSASASSWTTIQSYFIDSIAYKDSPLQPSSKQILSGGGIKYDFKTYNLDNQYYDIRAKSVCKVSASDVISYSDVASGIKDDVRPRLFGSPLPANGILTVNDEIQLNFSEDIADGLLSKSDFQVTGVINGSKGDHSTSIFFDGINDYIYTEADKNMTGKSLTFEAWVKRDKTGKAVLFSQGNINNNIEFGFNANDQLEVHVGLNVVTGSAIFTDLVNWQHVALVFDAEKEVVTIYQNFKTIVDEEPVSTYTGEGNMEFGRSLSAEDGYLNGKMHEVRVWNTVVTAANLQLNSLSILSGGELGLSGYWPMNESKGSVTFDKAGGANGILNGASWYLDPRGKALTLSGEGSFMKIETGSVVIKPDMEYTLELWFKGDTQTNATLISNGRGDGQDYNFNDTGTRPRDILWIGFNENSQLTVRNNGFETSVTGNFLDNDWHHLAFAVNRRGNAQILVDGELKNYFDASNLGGVASAYLYLGARSYTNLSNEKVKDMYFKGSVDEFRIWKLYLNETLVNKNNNVRLNGDELGLMAYYPFDEYITFQGENFLQFTASDKYVNTAALLPVLNGAAESDDIAPVKGRGPVKTLDFDFVINKDALIINLLQDRADVEKTIVTFSADNIQDLNGNRIASPVIWTAYIDRNQLKWEDTSLSLSKKANEQLTFTEAINNIGGSVQSFSIENLPTWLTASETYGTVDPNSSFTVTFTVNEALNIGSYDETIYLRNSDDVIEVLNLLLKVKGETPDWTVDPNDFRYNMSVYAKLRINNIFSNDKEDMIAAFVDGQCVGVANVQYEKRNDMWYSFLTVYGNQTYEEGLEFRIWDASTGKTYLADAGMIINFVNNSVIGTPSTPVIFDAKEAVYQNISLYKGWNWISFNVKSDQLNDLNSLLDNMSWDNNCFFKSEADNLSANYSQTESKWIAEKSFVLNNSLMYKISSSSDQVINICGTAVTPSSLDLNIRAGIWNHISYLPTVRLTLDEALAGYDAIDEDIIKSQTGFAMYAGEIGWVGSLSYLEPNKGYMLYRNGTLNTNLKYPDNSGSMSLSQKSLLVSESQDYVNTAYSHNMNLVAVTDIKTEENDKIEAYIGDVLLSSTAAQNITDRQLFFITVTGDNTAPVHFTLKREGNIIARTTKPYSFRSDAVDGTLSDPIVLKFGSANAAVSIYPNPVTDLLNVNVPAKEGSTIIIRILDSVGHELWIDTYQSDIDGYFEKQIDFHKFEKGVYLLQINSDQTISSQKIIKL